MEVEDAAGGYPQGIDVERLGPDAGGVVGQVLQPGVGAGGDHQLAQGEVVGEPGRHGCSKPGAILGWLKIQPS